MELQRKKDLRVTKTQRAIKETFKKMLVEKDASDITVKELSERAEIHRKTFYLHYTSIEALYDDIMNDIAENYYDMIDATAPDAPFSEVNRVFFTFFSEQEPYVQKLICSPSYREFSDKLFLTMMVHNRERYNPYAKYSKEQQDVINTFLCMTSVNIYRQWIESGRKMPLDELIDFSTRLFMYGISSVRDQ